MKKAQKQADPDPEKEALEERVRLMMDPAIENQSGGESAVVDASADQTGEQDDQERSAPPLAVTPDDSKPAKKKIAVLHAEESPPAPSLVPPIEAPTLDESIDETGVTGPPPVVKSRKVKAYESGPERQNIPEPTETAPVLTEESPPPTTVEDSDKVAFQKSALEATAQDPLFQPTPLDSDTGDSDNELPPLPEDPATNRAVEDILIREADTLLEVQDGATERVVTDPLVKPRQSMFGRIFSSRRKGKTILRLTALTLLLAVLVGGAVPTARYYALNQAGVRSSTSVIVLDDSTQQPLKNVTVTVAGQSAKTGSDGKASLERLPLGQAKVILEKRAFATTEFVHTFGWGSNPLGEYGISPTGVQYTLQLSDYVTGESLEGVEASSEEANAISDQDGKLVLTREDSEDTAFDLELTKEGYRLETLSIPADQKEQIELNMVLARKHVYISSQSGRFDIMQGDIDGKNESRLLAGTGSERDDMVLTSHPVEEFAGLVSTRDNKRNSDGFLLSSLTILNLTERTAKVVTTSERVQIIGWLDDRVIFVQVAAGESASSPTRHRLVSYDFKKQEPTELASSNFFNDVLVAGGKVLYAPSSAYQDNPQTGLFRVNADGSNKQIIVGKEVWNMFRISHDQLQIAGPAEWYSYNIGSSGIAMRLEPAPANPINRMYVDSPDGKHSLWLELRDGKGTLLFYDVAGRADSVLRSQPGLKYPLRWLNDTTLIFRIDSKDETADYVMSTKTTDVRKIRDVTNTGGIDRWYYY